MEQGAPQRGVSEMANFQIGTKASIAMTAALVAFGVTVYGTQAVSQGNGANDPTAVASFDKASVGGRSGCEVQSWPYIAPECLTPSSGESVKPARRI